jgi:hypothetical protein
MPLPRAIKRPPSVVAAPKKPVQGPLFDAEREPRAKPEEWRLDGPPVSVGTLPREVYQALCVLRMAGPCEAIVKHYDWDPMRIMRVIQRLATCGYVTMGDGGILSVRPEP